MAITKPIVSGYPDLKVVKKNEQINLSLAENFEHLYTDAFTLAVGETYFTEALLAGQDTALFLWADSTLLLNGKNKIKYTNNSAGPMQIQLVIKLFSDSDENGAVLPAGNYAMYKGDASYSDGSEPVDPGSSSGSGGTPVPDRLCVNTTIFITSYGDAVGRFVYVNANKIVVGTDTHLLLYNSIGEFQDSYKYFLNSSNDNIHTFDASLGDDGIGFIVIGLPNSSNHSSGSGSGVALPGETVGNQIGRVIILDQDLNFIKEIYDPDRNSSPGNDGFGSQVAISSEGMLVVVAPGEPSTVGSGSGAHSESSGLVYIFEDIPSGIYSNVIEIAEEFPSYEAYTIRVDVKGNGVNAVIAVATDGIAGGNL